MFARMGANTDTSTELTPVWLRIPGAVRVSGIGRSRLYELIRDQKIRSKVLKQRRDSQRGIRLISYDSLVEFINGSDAVETAEGGTQ